MSKTIPNDCNVICCSSVRDLYFPNNTRYKTSITETRSLSRNVLPVKTRKQMMMMMMIIITIIITRCRWVTATICPCPSPPTVGAEAPSAAEHTATYSSSFPRSIRFHADRCSCQTDRRQTSDKSIA